LRSGERHTARPTCPGLFDSSHGLCVAWCAVAHLAEHRPYLTSRASCTSSNVHSVVTAFAEDYRSTGRFQECLDRLKEGLSDPIADRLIESLRIAREVGDSDLGRLLRTLSAFLREDAQTRAELETRQGWTINAARLAVAAPWIILAMLSSRQVSGQGLGNMIGLSLHPVAGFFVGQRLQPVVEDGDSYR